jgi:pSer/pThr/pTyr-binding forkhead associated (FHA) protein
MAGEANVKTAGPRTPGGRTTPVLVPQAALAGQPDIPLDRPVTTVGSNEQARLHLVSRTVSKGHAIFVNNGGTTYVADMASRTGVLVNGKLVKDADLKTGDRVQIGKFQFRYRSPASTTPPPPQPDPPAAAIIVVGSPAVPVTRRVVTIGRRETCDIPIPTDAGVSACHAVIFQMDGKWFIRDLASRTGTTVNNKAVHQQQLNFGDRIAIGSATVLFQPGASSLEALEESGVIEIQHEAPADREEDIERLPTVTDEVPTDAPAAEHLVDWKSAFPADPVEELATPAPTQETDVIPFDDLGLKETPSTDEASVGPEPIPVAEDDFDFLGEETPDAQAKAPVEQTEAHAAGGDTVVAVDDDFDFLVEETPAATAEASVEPVPGADAAFVDQPAAVEQAPSAAAETALDDDFDFLTEESPDPAAEAVEPAKDETLPLADAPIESTDDLGIAGPQAVIEPQASVELESVHEEIALEPAPEAIVAEDEIPPLEVEEAAVASEPIAFDFADEAPSAVEADSEQVPVAEQPPVIEPELKPAAAEAEPIAEPEPVAATATESTPPLTPTMPTPVGIVPPVVAKELLEAVDDFVFVPTDSGSTDADVIFWGDDTSSEVPPPPPPAPPARDQSPDEDETPPGGGGPSNPEPQPIAPTGSGRSAIAPPADHSSAQSNGNGHVSADGPGEDALIEFADPSEPVALSSDFRIDADNWTAPAPLMFEPVPDIHIPEFQLPSVEEDYAVSISEDLGAAFSAAESWLQSSAGTALAPVMELTEEALTDAVSLVPDIEWHATTNTEVETEDGVAEATPAAMDSQDPAAMVASTTPEIVEDFEPVDLSEFDEPEELTIPSIEESPAQPLGVASANPDPVESVPTADEPDDESFEASGFEALPDEIEPAGLFDTPALTETPATIDFNAVTEAGAVFEPPREETITLSEEWASPVDATHTESDLDLLEFGDEDPAVAEAPADAPVQPAMPESAERVEAPAVVEPAPAPTERPATPPEPTQRRGPSLFGFNFDGGSFLGGMPISLADKPRTTPPAPALPEVSPPPSAPVDLAPTPEAPTPDAPAPVAPAPAPKASSTAFDLNVRSATGLGAMLAPVAKPLTPPRPLPRPMIPAQPPVAMNPVSLSGLVGELHPSIGTPVIPPIDKSTAGGGVRNLTGAARRTSGRSAEVFSQQGTPIGVEVFGGKPGNPNQFTIPDASANGGGLALATPNAPARVGPLPVVPLKIRWSRVSIYFGLMVLIPTMTWFGLHQFFKESVTQTGRLTFVGVGGQSDADLHNFHVQQIARACSDEVRQRALQIMKSQGQPPDFLASSESYRDYVQDKDFTPNGNSIEFQLSYPGQAQGKALITAIMRGLADRDQDLEVARRDARALADASRAEYDALKLQRDKLQDQYQKKSAEAENFPDALSVNQASQAVVDLTEKWQSASTVRKNTEDMLAQIKSQDPSKPIDVDNDELILKYKSSLQPLLDQIQIAKSKGGLSSASASGVGTDVSVGATTQPEADPLLGALQTQADMWQKKIQDRREELATLAAIPAAQRIVDQTRQIEDLTVKINTLKEAEKDLKTQLDTATDLANKNKAMIEAHNVADAAKQDLSIQMAAADAELKIKNDAWQKNETAYDNCITVAPPISGSPNPSVQYVSTSDLGNRFLLLISCFSCLFGILLIWGELRRPRLISGYVAPNPTGPTAMPGDAERALGVQGL